MKFNQVTIKDIARELNISPSTVSRALKDHPDISVETKKAVNALADKLNYQPKSLDGVPIEAVESFPNPKKPLSKGKYPVYFSVRENFKTRLSL